MTIRLLIIFLSLPLVVRSAELPADTVFARLQTHINANTLSPFDPKNETMTLTITINQKLGCPTCRWSPTNRVTTITTELPTDDQVRPGLAQTGLAGKSVTLNLKKL